MSTQTDRQPIGSLVAMASCMALQMTSYVMLLPLFARRFESLGAGMEALGASAMSYALASLLAAPFIGVLADRLGRRPIILFSLAAYILAFSGYFFAASAWLLILFRGAAGLLTAGLVPAMTSMVNDLAPANRRAQWIGVLGGGASAGWIGGPLLGGLLYDRFGYTGAVVVSIAMAVGALLLAVILIHETTVPVVHSRGLSLTWAHGVRALPIRPTVLLLLLITLGVMFAWAFIEPQFMFYAYDDLGWSSSQLGVVMSTYGLALMIGEFALGQLSDRLGRKLVLVVGLVLFSIQFVGLVVFRDPTWIMLSFFVAGLGNALYDPALSALILDLTPPQQTARMLGLKSTAGALGALLGPALVVLLADRVPRQTVFLIATALVLALALAIGLVLRRSEGSQVTQRLVSPVVVQ